MSSLKTGISKYQYIELNAMMVPAFAHSVDGLEYVQCNTACESCTLQNYLRVCQTTFLAFRKHSTSC